MALSMVGKHLLVSIRLLGKSSYTVILWPNGGN